MPPKISLKQSLELNVYLIQTILRGRGKEVIDLTMINPIR